MKPYVKCKCCEQMTGWWILTEPGWKGGAAGEALVGAAEGKESLAGPRSQNQPLRRTETHCVQHKLHR